jgi:hypothetical protein
MKFNRLNYQRGAALLLIAAAMIIGASVLSYQVLGNLGAKLKRQNAQEVGQRLSQAKESLLTFAAMQPDIYPSLILGNIPGVGYLPPPDFDNDGRMGTFNPTSFWYNTNNNNVTGRLPAFHNDANPFYFYTRSCTALGTVCANDDNTISIWAAMTGRNGAGNLRLQQRIEPLNSNTLLTQLDIDAFGNPNSVNTCATQGIVCLDGRPVVAVLIAADVPLSTQTGRPSNVVAQYLDMANSDANLYNFISRFPAGQTCAVDANRPELCFNDHVIAITYADWVQAMEARVRSEFTNLSTSLCSVTGRAAMLTHWAVRNQWQLVPSICPNPNLP